MRNADSNPAEISVIVDPNGHALVFQGFNQALFLSKENVTRFLDNPSRAAMLLIPPFAATALCTYCSMEEIDTIALTRDLTFDPDFSLVITTRTNSKIAYFSDHKYPRTPRLMARQGVSIVITPNEVSAVIQPEGLPQLTVIASIPQLEVPSYIKRFAVDPRIITKALEEALHKTNSTNTP